MGKAIMIQPSISSPPAKMHWAVVATLLAAGTPLFLLGYYGWAAVPDGYSINDAGSYSSMMTQGAPYKINYIRISLGVNRFTSTTNPPVYQGSPTPVPFVYVNGKAVLANTTT